MKTEVLERILRRENGKTEVLETILREEKRGREDRSLRSENEDRSLGRSVEEKDRSLGKNYFRNN